MKNHVILNKKENKKLSAKEKINEIGRLKEEVENNKDKLLDHSLDGESKMAKLTTNLKCEEHDLLHDIAVLESKLIKLEITPTQIDKIKKSILPS